MKLLYIIYQYPLYPKGSYLQEYINALAKKVTKISLIAYYLPKTEFKNPVNLKVYWLTKLNLGVLDELLFNFQSLFKVILNKDFKNLDLVNSIGPRGLLTGWYLKRKYNIPLVCTIEMLNKKDSLKNKLIYKLSRFLLTKIPIDKYICWSNYYQKRLLRWGISKQKITIIPPGIDTAKYHPKISGKTIKNKYSPNNPLLVFAKPLYLHHLKAVKLLVKTLAILKPKIKINLLVGNGEGKKQIKSFAKKINVADQLKFMLTVPFPQISKYLAAADLIVLPFTYAPTVSRSLLEALGMGKPVITTNRGELQFILNHNKNCLFTKNDPPKIAQAILEILKNPALSKRLSKNALILIKKRFCLEETVKKSLNCYQKVLKNG